MIKKLYALHIRKILIDIKNILIYSGYMKKLILTLVLLFGLLGCTNDKVVSGVANKLLNTYYDVYYYVDYDNACLNVQIINSVSQQSGSIEYTIEKEWVISPNNYQIHRYGVYGYMEHNNVFYEYSDYYLIVQYYREK